ncbi:hypothetical protein BH23BAC1_BH23BAC1_00160 [soil metagenome]
MKLILFPAFIIISLIQLFFPAKMIWNRERVIAANNNFKFRTAPVDPHDPFRGKYLFLQFQENQFKVDGSEDWAQNQDVFVLLSEDKEGFVKIADVYPTPPDDTPLYIKAKIGYVYDDAGKKIIINYPFEKFYMEESKAYDAELAYNASAQDTTKVTYALVSVLKGEAVLNDVFIDNVSIKEVVKRK